MKISKKRNILLTGLPGIGKSTIISAVVEEFSKRGVQPSGFFTQEVKNSQTRQREGFEIVPLCWGTCTGHSGPNSPGITSPSPSTRSYESQETAMKTDDYRNNSNNNYSERSSHNISDTNSFGNYTDSINNHSSSSSNNNNNNNNTNNTSNTDNQCNLPRGSLFISGSEGDNRVTGCPRCIRKNTVMFAHVNFPKTFSVGRYGVDVASFEKVVLVELSRSSQLCIIDEIGKMETLFSDNFNACVQNLLDSPDTSVLGTIAMLGGGFIRDVKSRKDIEIIEVTSANRQHLPDLILTKFLS